MLGTEGKDYGAYTYYCKECTLDVKIKKIKFNTTSDSLLRVYVQSSRAVNLKFKSLVDNKYLDAGFSVVKIDEKDNYSLLTAVLQPGCYFLQIRNSDYTKEIPTKVNFRMEFVESFTVEKLKNKKRSSLPSSISEFQRTKVKAPGQKESDFIIGTLEALQYYNENALLPFITN